MTIEAATFLNSLTSANPGVSDQIPEGDDHIRLLKTVLKATFPGRGGEEGRTITKAAGFTPALTENGAVFVCTATLAVTLAALAGLPEGTGYTFYAQTGSTTLTPSGVDTVSGAASQVLTVGQSCDLVKQGTNWVMLASSYNPLVLASRAEMEAGTEAAIRAISPLRVAQAIAILAQTANPEGPVGAVVGGGTLTISCGPISVNFRSTTLNSGVLTTLLQTPADLVISSGSSLGTASGNTEQIAVLAINNSGTIVLGVTRITDGKILDESVLIDTVAEGGAGTADNPAVIYTATALTGKAFKVIGLIELPGQPTSWTLPVTVVSGERARPRLNALRQSEGQYKTMLGASSVEWTGIPTWAKRIEIDFANFQTSDSSIPLLQVGSSGGWETSGYKGSFGSTPTLFTNGFAMMYTWASTCVAHGRFILTQTYRLNGTAHWVCTLSGGRSDFAHVLLGGGSILPSGAEVDRVRLTTVGGTATGTNSDNANRMTFY